MEVVISIITIIISIASLAVAIIALVRAWPINKVQLNVLEMDKKIKESELDKITKDNAVKCEIDVDTVKYSEKKYIIRIWNSGNVDAYNINLAIEKDSGYIIIDEKLPWEKLKNNESIDINVLATYSRKDKFVIDWNWENSQKEKFNSTKYACF